MNAKAKELAKTNYSFNKSKILNPKITNTLIMKNSLKVIEKHKILICGGFIIAYCIVLVIISSKLVVQ